MPKVRIVLQAATVCTKAAAGALYIPLFRFSFFLFFFLFSYSGFRQRTKRANASQKNYKTQFPGAGTISRASKDRGWTRGHKRVSQWAFASLTSIEREQDREKLWCRADGSPCN